ncbi:MAG: MBL fold metallo-hydrolase [Nitrososphaeria archaeon]
MVKVTFLGVGGWISEPSLGYTSILIENCGGEKMLLDAGEGVYRMLKCCGYDVDDLNYVVITHSHGDHVLGLPTLVQMRIHKGLKRLQIITSPETSDAIRNLLNITCNFIPETFVEIIELNYSVEHKVGGFKLKFIKAPHTVSAVSVKVEADEKTIVYSGDTVYNPNLIEFAKGCNLLIHEAANYSKDAYKFGHSSYDEAIRIALEAEAETLALIHFYQKPLPVKIEDFSGRLPRIFIPYPCTFLEI